MSVLIRVGHISQKLSFLARCWCSHLPFCNLAFNNFVATFISIDESCVVFLISISLSCQFRKCSEAVHISLQNSIKYACRMSIRHIWSVIRMSNAASIIMQPGTLRALHSARRLILCNPYFWRTQECSQWKGWLGSFFAQHSVCEHDSLGGPLNSVW